MSNRERPPRGGRPGDRRSVWERRPPADRKPSPGRGPGPDRRPPQRESGPRERPSPERRREITERRREGPAGEWLYGRNAVRECLRARRRRPRRLLVAHGTEKTQPVVELSELARSASVEVQETGREELDGLTGGANHQGVCLLVDGYPYLALPDLLEFRDRSTYLVLDSLQDPQNLGALLRTAEAAGVSGVVIPEHRAASVTPAVANTSAGASEHLRVARVTNIARALDDLKRAGSWVVGLEATPDAVPLWEAPLDGPVALVIGAEGEGIRRLVLKQCDVVASLPLHGEIESLNAAVAGSVALYEVLRRREDGTGL